METFHLYHLADIWTRRAERNRVPGHNSSTASQRDSGPPLDSLPPTHLPVLPHIISLPPAHPPPGVQNTNEAGTASGNDSLKSGIIRASALQMVFAARTSQDFITPAQVAALEYWSGKIALEAVCRVPISDDVIALC